MYSSNFHPRTETKEVNFIKGVSRRNYFPIFIPCDTWIDVRRFNFAF